MSRQIITEIIGDASKFAKATGDAQANASRFGNVMQGIGMGIGINFASLATQGVEKVVGFLGDAVKAAMEEQASVQRLGTALKANIPIWDGNTASIEKLIGAQMDLGFSDEEQRDSLARLVAATHDVAKAQDIQRTAMDLARFKGISLADATDALIKVEAGQYRGLKALGIELRTGATQEEALTAVRKVAAGQAAEYAQTTEGKLLVAQTKFGDLMDRLGVQLLPIVNSALTGMVGSLDVLSGGFDKAGDSSLGLFERIQGVADVIQFFGAPGMSALKGAVAEAREQQDLAAASAKAMAERYTTTTTAVKTAARDHQSALDGVATKAASVTGLLESYNMRVARSYKSTADYLLTTYTSDYNKAAAIVDARATLSANAQEAANLRKQISSGKLTATELADAQKRLVELNRSDAEQYADLEKYNALSEADYDAWKTAIQTAFAGATGASATARDNIIANINALRAAAALTINVTTNYRTTYDGVYAGGIGGKATGGSASGLTWVGEKGPELVSLPQGSYVYDNATSMRMARGGGGGGGSPLGGTTNVAIHIDQGAFIDGPSVDRLALIIGQRLRLKGIN